jgi:hypothetical protein
MLKNAWGVARLEMRARTALSGIPNSAAISVIESVSAIELFLCLEEFGPWGTAVHLGMAHAPHVSCEGSLCCFLESGNDSARQPFGCELARPCYGD